MMASHTVLFHFLLVLTLTLSAHTTAANADQITTQEEGGDNLVPEELCSPFGSYPNVLDISEDDRKNFHPVIRLPNKLPVIDNTISRGLSSPNDMEAAKKQKRWQRWWKRISSKPPFRKGLSSEWNIGRYDEDRKNMYTSEIHDNAIDGFGGHRTVHLGVDIGAPAGTKVHSFSDGIVWHAGYNPDEGDYGYVVVLGHLLPGSNRTVYALYGHLAKEGIDALHVGTPIAKGDFIGRVGDCHENGGWKGPHVHFQLAVTPPETHDMPGACSVEDRSKALLNYPDPRYVLGQVH